MRRELIFLALVPMITGAKYADERAVRAVLNQMIAGQPVSDAILDRQIGHPEFANLDATVASVKGCKAAELEPLPNGSFGVQWYCKDRKAKDQPSAMMVYLSKGQVTRTTTANVMMVRN
ncbi:hypothetical protein [Novosphingobium sp.]|uniref:hypothetical protein n=1 Tax=Novosphingobium sp. TaxID=1874826 RepID=UPI0025E3F70A|nr:hypothetical protein [Novosphingobium sp.]